jgi:catechol 2,3-dioxygenase-like lactoylglutathione lyase family enzyme
MIKGMNHVGVSVSDLNRAIAFYRDVLGMEVVVQRPFGGEKYEMILGLKGARGQVALLRFGDIQIELFEFASPRPKRGDPRRPICDHGITHFCLEVTDIDDAYARLKAKGVSFHCSPQSFSGKAIATYGRDPDGNVFELLEMTRADETK